MKPTNPGEIPVALATPPQSPLRTAPQHEAQPPSERSPSHQRCSTRTCPFCAPRSGLERSSPLELQEAQRGLGQLLESRRMDLDSLQFGALVDQLQESNGGWRGDEMNHPLPWIKLGDLLFGADDSDLHGGGHTPHGAYPAARAFSELENQISFSGWIFPAHRQLGYWY
jgi:hypothetical protein